MASPTEPSASRSVFLGVDVGTGSARAGPFLLPIHFSTISFHFSLNWIMNCVAFDAGLFDEEGKLLGSSSSPIQIWKDGAFVEVT